MFLYREDYNTNQQYEANYLPSMTTSSLGAQPFLPGKKHT